MSKHTDQDKDRLRALVAEFTDAEIKPLFGSIGACVNGNMFAMVFSPTIGVKLNGTDKSTLEALDGAGPFGPAERPMGGWVSLPESMTDDDAVVWIEKARAYVATLPPKVKK